MCDNKKTKFQTKKRTQSSIKKFHNSNIIEIKEDENKIRKNKEKKIINNNVEIALGEKRKRENKKVYENEKKKYYTMQMTKKIKQINIYSIHHKKKIMNYFKKLKI